MFYIAIVFAKESVLLSASVIAYLSIWQSFESHGCVSTLTENNQPVNKFELIA